MDQRQQQEANSQYRGRSLPRCQPHAPPRGPGVASRLCRSPSGRRAQRAPGSRQRPGLQRGHLQSGRSSGGNSGSTSGPCTRPDPASPWRSGRERRARGDAGVGRPRADSALPSALLAARCRCACPRKVTRRAGSKDGGRPRTLRSPPEQRFSAGAALPPESRGGVPRQFWLSRLEGGGVRARGAPEARGAASPPRTPREPSAAPGLPAPRGSHTARSACCVL